MRSSSSKLDQALKDLIEAYVEMDGQMNEKYEEDEDAYSAAMLETLEASIEGALEDQDVETKSFANMLSYFSDALEQLDPVAFDDATEGEEEEYKDDEDEDDIDYDEDEEEEDEDEEE